MAETETVLTEDAETVFTQDMTKYRITEAGKHLATTTSLRNAQIAVARRIASDVEGRILRIDGPTGSYLCRANDRFCIDYVAVAG
jgi:hypothetical protein